MSGRIPEVSAGISAGGAGVARGAAPLPPGGIAGPLARTDSLAGLPADYGEFRPVPRLIEDQADLTPGRTAVCYGGRELSYDQLDRLASGLAAAVAGTGTGRGDRVATSIVNSLEMPVAYLALMKLGAVFVPVDPGWPAERLATTLRVLSPRLILCLDPGQVPAEFGALAMPVAADRIAASPRRPAVPLGPAEECYGFFTSGTTGTPKCALNRHGGLANRLRFMTRWFGAAGGDVVLQNSKHTFDSSLWQLLWPLITGGRAVLPAAGEFLDLQHTIDTIAGHRVTATDFVSSIFNILVTMADRDEQARRKLASLRCLVVGSEEINARAVHRMRELLPGLAITNGYGPTETTIGMVFHPVSDADGDVIPLGRPIDNCYVAVLGPDRAVLPRGTIGEIAIGGACVGAGYHGNQAATGRVFIPNHLAGRIPGDLLYLSGDFGYLDEAGRLFFSGRKDFQVKIGGVRIELGEIEAAAQRCPGVSQAKALVAERDGVKSLALFAAGDGRPTVPGRGEPGPALADSALTESALTESVLREHLRRLLPRTSVPRHCVVLERMPLGEVGKIDWRALQAVLDRRLDAAGGDTAGMNAAGRDAAGADASGQAGLLGRADPARVPGRARPPRPRTGRGLHGGRRRLHPGPGRGAPAHRRVRGARSVRAGPDRAAHRARAGRPDRHQGAEHGRRGGRDRADGTGRLGAAAGPGCRDAAAGCDRAACGRPGWGQARRRRRGGRRRGGRGGRSVRTAWRAAHGAGDRRDRVRRRRPGA